MKAMTMGRAAQLTVGLQMWQPHRWEEPGSSGLWPRHWFFNRSSPQTCQQVLTSQWGHLLPSGVKGLWRPMSTFCIKRKIQTLEYRLPTGAMGKGHIVHSIHNRPPGRTISLLLLESYCVIKEQWSPGGGGDRWEATQRSQLRLCL
jgi:hypothetical protein